MDEQRAQDGHGHKAQRPGSERQGEQADDPGQNAAPAVARPGAVVEQGAAHGKRAGHAAAHADQDIGQAVQTQFAVQVHVQAGFHFDGH